LTINEAKFQPKILLDHAIGRVNNFAFAPILLTGDVCQTAPAEMRYGTDRSEAVEDVLDEGLLNKSKAELARLKGGGKQSSTVSWSGGYWHSGIRRSLCLQKRDKKLELLSRNVA
jgi:hypothetical protein